MWASIRKFVYVHSSDKIKVEVSEADNIAILGAAALYYDVMKKPHGKMRRCLFHEIVDCEVYFIRFFKLKKMSAFFMKKRVAL